MSLSAISLYISPPGSVYSSELDPSSRGSSPCTTAAPPPPSTSHRPSAVAGGLSCLFSSPAAAAARPRAPAHDELGALWHDRSDDLSFASGGYSHSHSPSPLKRRDLHHHSPVSVFQGPSSSPASRSPSASWLAGRERDRLFSGFVRNALGSCIDYVPATSPRPEVGGGELAFELDENLSEASPACEPYARKLLAGAQARHRIFHEELVVKAFFEAEEAHRGQTRASGDPYLQHCVETAVLLAKIGANATVVSAGLLHDTIDDSFVDYDHIFHMFGAGVADLVEGMLMQAIIESLKDYEQSNTKTTQSVASDAALKENNVVKDCNGATDAALEPDASFTPVRTTDVPGVDVAACNTEAKAAEVESADGLTVNNSVSVSASGPSESNGSTQVINGKSGSVESQKATQNGNGEDGTRATLVVQKSRTGSLIDGLTHKWGSFFKNND